MTAITCYKMDKGVSASEILLTNVSGVQPSRQKEEICSVSVTTELLQILKKFILPL